MNRSKSFDNSKPLIYLIATPIGNLGEMSKRALDVLQDMDIIAAEDTRNTFSLLSNFGIKKELFSLREHNEIEASEHLIKLAKSGKKVAYVSDAGYPGISDPGYLLVKKAREEDVAVSTISGSCAFINALVASGLPTNHFYFYGFLSKKGQEAKKALEELSNRNETLIFYESPHQIEETIKLLNSVLGDRECVIARELTKINEEYISGKLSELVNLDFKTIKGEMVIILEGQPKSDNEISDEKIQDKIRFYLSLGVSEKAAIQIAVEELKVPKNRVYKLVQEMK
ncbi:MAG: 16S rRNA (cytidine(1402)-2'-O)-methyltransferase [Bacilli bacterium]|nr:16S rRNA (cytidine(1402)-2'-O)-methyltransferase [Bacilli bacterium]